jgi:hypothetical protein
MPDSMSEYIESVEIDGERHAGSEVVVDNDGKTERVVVNLAEDPATIRGHIDAPSNHESPVAVVLQSESSDQIWTKTSDLFGTFCFGGLAPGHYRLYAWPNLDNVEYRNPHFLSRFASEDKEVAVEGEITATNIELSPIAPPAP